VNDHMNAQVRQTSKRTRPVLGGWTTDEKPRLGKLNGSGEDHFEACPPGLEDAYLPPTILKKPGDISNAARRRASVGPRETVVKGVVPKAAEPSKRASISQRSSVAVGKVKERMSRVATSIKPAEFGKKSKAKSTMFANGDILKQKMHENLLGKRYKVEDRYHKTGVAQCIARHTWFECITLSVIACNALWIGYDVDKNPSETLPDAPLLFQVVENIFCFYFTFELVVRFAAFEKKKSAFKDFQFDFDFGLVCVMITETWVIYLVMWMNPGGGGVGGGGAVSLLRMLRLSRMVRLVRLLRAVPELMVLIRGLQAAFPSVAWTLGFLVIVIYVFSVAFNILLKDEQDLRTNHFSSVPHGMVTLLLPGLFPDNVDIVEELGGETGHLLYAVLFVGFLAFGTIMVMNMLIGVLCEVVSVVASMEKEEANVNFVRERLRNLMESLDVDGDGMLSKKEVEDLVMMPGASRVMNDVGVDVYAFCEIAEFYLFDRSEEIPFGDFVELVLKLRGNNNVCVRDLVFLRQFIAEELEVIPSAVEERLRGFDPGIMDGPRGSMDSELVTLSESFAPTAFSAAPMPTCEAPMPMYDDFGRHLHGSTIDEV